jgi:hypothetical protein
VDISLWWELFVVFKELITDGDQQSDGKADPGWDVRSGGPRRNCRVHDAEDGNGFGNGVTGTWLHKVMGGWGLTVVCL